MGQIISLFGRVCTTRQRTTAKSKVRHMLAIKKRIALLRSVYNRPLSRRALSLWAIIAAYDTFVSQILPEELAKKAPRVAKVVSMTSGWLSWKEWLLVPVVFFILIQFDYIYRRSQKNKNAKVNDIETESLPLSFERKITKKIVLKIDSLGVDLQRNFVISSPINLSQNYLILEGAESVLKNYTDTIFIKIPAKKMVMKLIGIKVIF